MSKLFNTGGAYYGWTVVTTLFIISAYTGGAVYFGFTAIIEPIADEMGWNYTTISLAASLRGTEASLLAPLIGAVIDRYGARKPMFIGVLLTGAGLILLSQMQTLAVYYASFVLITLGVSTTSVTAIMTVVARWFRRRLGLATGITFSGFAFGSLAILAINVLVATYDWRVAMLALAGGTFVLILPMLLLLRDKPDPALPPVRREMGMDVPRSGSAKVGAFNEGDSVSLKQALGMRPLWHILAAFALLVFVVMTVTTHIMPYLSSVAVDRAQAGVVATLLAVLSIIGRLALGWVTDRWPYQRAMMVALLVMVVGLVCFIMVALDPVYLIPFLVIFPIGFGGAMVLRPPFVLEYFGQARFGTIFGLTMSASLLGGIAGPPLAGYIYDTSGNYFWFWVISIGALLLAVVAILTCPRPPKPAPRVNPV